MEDFLVGLEVELGSDHALILASLALADLADYIGTFFDPAFELVRYGESLAASHQGFAEVERLLDSPVLRDFYRPVLDEMLAGLCGDVPGDLSCGVLDGVPHGLSEDDRILVCVSCPFPGTLAAALASCLRFKEALGNRAFVVMGGGYVNTELRQVQEPRLAAFLDALSYDRGYGSYWDFFRRLEEVEGRGTSPAGGENSTDGEFPPGIKSAAVYKMKFFGSESDGGDENFVGGVESVSVGESVGGGELVVGGKLIGGGADAWRADCWRKVRQVEDDFTARLTPDFSDVDFSRYPRLADSTNPMHRLWSDGTWLKAYLAHGCYWHRCSFCDTSLDYVCSYRRVGAKALYQSLYRQARRAGVAGVHLVDEAAPPAALKEFALENLDSVQPLVFWGNIRYEKTFTRDLADLLSHGGLRAVSGGIEIACGSGLDAVQKGTDVDSIVAACAAFKEAGILTHAYMMYGYWNETPQMLVDSMETLRQLFAAGLLDSAFWHKFVLTRHSRIFAEWRRGLHPDLRPVNPDSDEEGIFATNDLRFAGEEKSEKYGDRLNRALAAWMAGEGLDKPVRSWFNFSLPRPSVPADVVEQSIARYENLRDRAYRDYEDFCRCQIRCGEEGQNLRESYCWLGGRPLVESCKGRLRLSWIFMGELISADFPPQTDRTAADRFARWLYGLAPSAGKMQACDLPAEIKFLYKKLRPHGLCRLR